MVDFRRCITALAILALFAGFAVAQTNGGNTQLVCSTNVTVTPNLRGEGYTEQTGDITLTCTGGVPTGNGLAIPAVNITVFYNTAVTSRLLPTSASSAISEALLLIDEPGSGLPPLVPGFGPAAPQILCSTPLQGCTEFANSTLSGQTPPIQVATGTSGGTTARTERVPGRSDGQLRDVLRYSGVGPRHDELARLPHHERSCECESAGRRLRFGRLPGSGFDLDQRCDFAVDFECDPVRWLCDQWSHGDGQRFDHVQSVLHAPPRAR